MVKWWLVILVVGVLIGGVACTRTSRSQETIVEIDLIGPLFSPPVGRGPVVIEVNDLAGNPVDNAQVTVRGDMAHAGMVPVITKAVNLGGNTYRALMDWTMAGDWIVTVEVKLADGQIARQRFDLTVTSDETECNDSE